MLLRQPAGQGVLGLVLFPALEKKRYKAEMPKWYFSPQLTFPSELLPSLVDLAHTDLRMRHSS